MSLRIDYEPALSDPYGYAAEDALCLATGRPCDDEECAEDCPCPGCRPDLHDVVEMAQAA